MWIFYGPKLFYIFLNPRPNFVNQHHVFEHLHYPYLKKKPEQIIKFNNTAFTVLLKLFFYNNGTNSCVLTGVFFIVNKRTDTWLYDLWDGVMSESGQFYSLLS